MFKEDDDAVKVNMCSLLGNLTNADARNALAIVQGYVDQQGIYFQMAKRRQTELEIQVQKLTEQLKDTTVNGDKVKKLEEQLSEAKQKSDKDDQLIDRMKHLQRRHRVSTMFQTWQEERKDVFLTQLNALSNLNVELQTNNTILLKSFSLYGD